MNMHLFIPRVILLEGNESRRNLIFYDYRGEAGVKTLYTFSFIINYTMYKLSPVRTRLKYKKKYIRNI